MWLTVIPGWTSQTKDKDQDVHRKDKDDKEDNDKEDNDEDDNTLTNVSKTRACSKTTRYL